MENKNLNPFINMYLGIGITSFLMIVTGFLAKFNFIVTEKYNFGNWINGGIIVFISGTIIFGVSLLFILDQGENEESEDLKSN